MLCGQNKCTRLSFCQWDMGRNDAYHFQVSTQNSFIISISVTATLEAMCPRWHNYMIEEGCLIHTNKALLC